MKYIFVAVLLASQMMVGMDSSLQSRCIAQLARGMDTPQQIVRSLASVRESGSFKGISLPSDLGSEIVSRYLKAHQDASLAALDPLLQYVKERIGEGDSLYYKPVYESVFKEYAERIKIHVIQDEFDSAEKIMRHIPEVLAIPVCYWHGYGMREASLMGMLEDYLAETQDETIRTSVLKLLALKSDN